MAKNPEFGDRLIKAADTLRITGNNAVYPGEMSEEDLDNVSNCFLGFLNLIVNSAINDTRKRDAIYEALPENPRREVELKDGRSK